MTKYTELTALQTDLQSGKINCVQLVQAYLQKIKDLAHLNAFLEVYETEALQKAKQIDEKLKTGTAGKLAGLVISVKDTICHKNHHINAGSKILGNFTSLLTATALQRLLDQDAIVIGRNNCDEFAMGSSNEQSAFGAVRHPLDNERVPGGSSGGSAAAVAGGMCLAAIGSDTGGSIRQPASFCGLVAIKPTYGRVSRYGLIAYASSFDQICPITNSVSDAAIMLQIMSGKDELDNTSSSQPVDNYANTLNKNTQKVKIGVIKEAMEMDGLDSDIKNGINNLIEKLKNKGHLVEPVSFPYIDYVVPIYYILATAEASSNLARFDGVRYGFRDENAKSIDELFIQSRSKGFGNEVKRRIMLGTFVLSSGYYDAYYNKAQQVRRAITDYTQKLLKNYDFILSPTCPDVAFKIGEKSKDPIKMYLSDIYTIPANLSGNPAINLPLGKNNQNLPYGVQLLGRNFQETQLFSFANNLI